MTTWFNILKSTKAKAILREQGDIILREQGDWLLQEDDNLDYSSGTKHTATWSSLNRATTSWASPIKN